MAKTVIGEHGFYKLDHPCFREVYETTYIEDVIVDIHLGPDGGNSLLNLPNTCELEDSGTLLAFYNCKKGCYTDQTGLIIGNALVDGVKAFEIGERVKVGCERKTPRYIIGHAAHEPRMCADILRMKVFPWKHNGTIYTGATDFANPYYIYYVGALADEYCELSKVDDCSDPYDTLLSSVCTERGYILFGKREFTVGTVINYWGDFFAKVGPIMYILRVKSIGIPAPLTGVMEVLGAIWTEELEAECKQCGEAAEHTIPIRMFSPMPTQPNYPSAMKQQAIFTNTFTDRFAHSLSKVPHPRWIFTELWGQR